MRQTSRESEMISERAVDRIGLWITPLWQHNLFGKPVPIFRAHAGIATLTRLGAAWQQGESIV
jgi:hypothetical protein